MWCNKKWYGHNFHFLASTPNQRGVNPLELTLIPCGGQKSKIVTVLYFFTPHFWFQFFSKRGSTSAGRNSALKTPYPPLPYIFWKLWTCSFTWYHPIYDIPIQKIDGDAIPRPKKTVILGVRSPDYMVKSAIFKVWVISATSMHEIILHAIDMHKNRFKTNF